MQYTQAAYISHSQICPGRHVNVFGNFTRRLYISGGKDRRLFTGRDFHARTVTGTINQNKTTEKEAQGIHRRLVSRDGCRRNKKISAEKRKEKGKKEEEGRISYHINMEGDLIGGRDSNGNL